jgi:hypothetical protein
MATQIDDFRSSLELLLEDKKKKLAYYHDRIADYKNRSLNTEKEINRLLKVLASKEE